MVPQSLRVVLLILSALDSRVLRKMLNNRSVRSKNLESAFFSLLFFSANSFFVPLLVIVTIPRICSRVYRGGGEGHITRSRTTAVVD